MATDSSTVYVPPSVGMLATVRNRSGVISAVEPFDGGERGRLHLVTLEYTDAATPGEDRLIWEREAGARVLPPVALPDVARDAPMPGQDLDALIRATRWSAISPFVDPDGPDGLLTRLPIAAPFHAAINVEDFQLVPLLKALRMPRVSLLLADDVGLGKTIEAGLILSELLIRRRVRRVLIICPASLRIQWRQEMRDKFALAFDEVDRESTHSLRKSLGMDANPWRTHSRIVTSYDYLKQADVFEEFRAASVVPETSPHLPWDLLIVDEAHHLTPAAFGEDSDLAQLLKNLTPLFEHRLFLTATPHNGHTRSFTGLLERLDPVRFSQRDELSAAERARVEQVLVRRLKREINERTSPPLFANRNPPQALQLRLSAAERDLAGAFQAFRAKVHALVAAGSRGDQLAGSFAVEVLGKRLLSCPVAFADSWLRYQEGLRDPEEADLAEVRAAERASKEELSDDREAEGRTAHAARTVGMWLKPLQDRLRMESDAITKALSSLVLDQYAQAASMCPSTDARWDALAAWVDANLRRGSGWAADERLVVFTEYKTTLDYVEARLRERYRDDSAIRVLFGGMPEDDREEIKAAFNDPDDPVRILVATDAASEGLNLQETARYLLHYDVPWNPARLEQRNGRLDRHGQARDVTVFHFTSDDEADLRFLAYVISKVDTIREDLGAIGEVFDAALQSRLVKGKDEEAVRRQLDVTLQANRGQVSVPRDAAATIADAVEAPTSDEARSEAARLAALADELDLDADSLRDTLEVALGLRAGRPRFEGPDDRGRLRLKQPIPPAWEDLVDDALRLTTRGHAQGPLPGLVFDPRHFIKHVNGRPVFRPERDTALLHLAHPLFQRALVSFAQLRFPGRTESATRWTVRRGELPVGADAAVLLTVEELAVNELRETFHHWLRTICVPIQKDSVGEPIRHVPARHLRTSSPTRTEDTARARDLWDEVSDGVRNLVKGIEHRLTETLSAALETERMNALQRERDRFQSRQGELSSLIQQQSLKRLESEIAQLQDLRRQGLLFDPEDRLADLVRSEQTKKEELQRRQAHYEELRAQLTKERERVIDHLIPKRFTMRGAARVFPVAVEIRLPEARR